MKQGKTLSQLASELERRQAAKLDFVADTRALHVNNDGRTLEVAGGDSSVNDFNLSNHAARQLGTWAGVPAKYAEKCFHSDPAFYARNMNHWLKNNDARRMIRTMDGDCRAFLSDRYRRIDHEDVTKAVLPVLMEIQDLHIVSCDVTDRRLYLKALFPSVQAEIEGSLQVGDLVQAGVVISNSEIGMGSLQVQPLVMRLVCLNGMIANQSGLARHHVGRKIEGEGQDVAQLFRDETIEADDRALMLKLQDIVRAAASEAQFKAIVKRMSLATVGPQIEQPVPAVEVLSKTFGLNDQEGNSVLESLIKGLDYSRWGTLNAITSVANNTENYDRATELEALGGRVLDMPRSEWYTIAEASADSAQ